MKNVTKWMRKFMKNAFFDNGSPYIQVVYQ